VHSLGEDAPSGKLTFENLRKIESSIGIMENTFNKGKKFTGLLG